jgi:transcriptional regulator GlxA family with amidase domain
MEERDEERLTKRALQLGVAHALERAFRGELQIAPSAYYRRLRLAPDLLADSALLVRDVALACGFANLSSFARAFRTERGQVSSRLRRHG